MLVAIIFSFSTNGFLHYARKNKDYSVENWEYKTRFVSRIYSYMKVLYRVIPYIESLGKTICRRFVGASVSFLAMGDPKISVYEDTMSCGIFRKLSLFRKQRLFTGDVQMIAYNFSPLSIQMSPHISTIPEQDQYVQYNLALLSPQIISMAG